MPNNPCIKFYGFNNILIFISFAFLLAKFGFYFIKIIFQFLKNYLDVLIAQ